MDDSDIKSDNKINGNDKHVKIFKMAIKNLNLYLKMNFIKKFKLYIKSFCK